MPTTLRLMWMEEVTTEALFVHGWKPASSPRRKRASDEYLILVFEIMFRYALTRCFLRILMEQQNKDQKSQSEWPSIQGVWHLPEKGQAVSWNRRLGRQAGMRPPFGSDPRRQTPTTGARMTHDGSEGIFRELSHARARGRSLTNGCSCVMRHRLSMPLDARPGDAGV
jgi:hypothetical protein